MATTVAFHTQLASIMEVLANAAVAEICELVDNGYAVLQLEVSRSHKENEALKRRLRLMELKVARASALRTGVGSSFFASSRARAQSAHLSNELKRAHNGEAQLLRVTAPVPNRSEDAAPSGDTGQDRPKADAQRKPAAVELVKTKTPVIKVERVDEVWANTEPEKGFPHAVDNNPKEHPIDVDALPPVTKQEVSELDDSTSCSWVGGDISTALPSVPKSLPSSSRGETSSATPEPVGYDCMMYEPQLQHGPHSAQNPPTEDPGCSYSLSANVSISSSSESGSGFPFAIDEVDQRVAEHQQAAAFMENRQRAPLSTDEPQMSARKDIQAVSSAFAMREDWVSQDGYNNVTNYNRDDSAGKTFICSFCGKTLACLKNLKTHMRVHTGEKPFSCALCGKRFSDSSNLKRHQSVHTGEKRYGCVHCGKRFAQSGSLKVHMSVHSGCKQFKCPHCGKTFISANHLRRHITIHEGEKRLSATF